MQLCPSKHFIAAPVFACLLAACGNTAAPIESPSKGCSSGSAEIAVYDNDSAVLCGCKEDAGRVAPGSNLKCSVSKDTVVFVHFLGVQNRHELAPTGTPVFPPSPAINPTADSPIRDHAVKLTDVGTYDFKDLQNSQIYGQIIVQ